MGKWVQFNKMIMIVKFLQTLIFDNKFNKICIVLHHAGNEPKSNSKTLVKKLIESAF